MARATGLMTAPINGRSRAANCIARPCSVRYNKSHEKALGVGAHKILVVLGRERPHRVARVLRLHPRVEAREHYRAEPSGLVRHPCGGPGAPGGKPSTSGGPAFPAGRFAAASHPGSIGRLGRGLSPPGNPLFVTILHRESLRPRKNELASAAASRAAASSDQGRAGSRFRQDNQGPAVRHGPKLDRVSGRSREAVSGCESMVG
jgi:hypothetical protein